MDPIDTLQQRITNLVTGENIPINAYTTAKQITGDVNAERDTVAGMTEDSTGSTFLSGVYKGGMTVADIAAQAGIAGIANGGSSAFAKTAGIRGEELLKKLTALWKTELKNTGIDDVGKLVTGNAKTTINDAANLLADETVKKLDDMNFIDESTLSKGVSNESVINQMVDDWNGGNTGSQLADNANEVYDGKGFTEGAGENTLFRGDDLLYEEKRPNGISKSYLNSVGDLVPANVNGLYKDRQVTVTEHILGGYRKGAKGNSPYTSFTNDKGIVATYGNSIIKVDMNGLIRDINAGKIRGVEILTPEQVQALIKSDIQESEYWRELALIWAKRDKEHLIKGIIPQKYITIITNGGK